MKQKKNIDRLFQEKFKNFEVHPSDQVWQNIVERKKEEEDRKIIPIWWRLGGIAAILLLLVTTAIVLWNNTSSTINSTPGLVNAHEQKSANPLVNTGSKNDIEDSSVSTQVESGLVTDVNTTEKTATSTERENKDTEENNIIFDVNNTQGAVAIQNKPEVTQKTNNNNNTTNINKEKRNQKYIDNTSNSTQLNRGDVAVDKTDKENRSQKRSDLIDPTITINKSIDNTTVAVIEEGKTKTSQSTDAEENSKKSLVDEAARIEDAKEQDDDLQDKEALVNRWNVGAVAAPVFYGDFGGSGIDPQFKDNNKTSDANLSYGVQVSYAVTPKFKVRTGVSNVDLNYNTQDISFTASNTARVLRGVDFSESARFLDITDAVNPSAINSEDAEFGQGGNAISNGEIQQNVGYVEIPLEAIYVLSDSRLGVELIGGVSTLVLNNNELFLESNGLRTNLGTSNDLNDISFTTNIGLGLNYKITEKVKVNVEPSLKYQLNAYSENIGEFKPYYIGLYTGVNYRF